MEKQISKTEKAFVMIAAVMGWFAVIGQLYLIILNRTTPVLDTVIKFISFYTILTNILAATCFTYILLNSKSRWGKFFSRPTVLTATTVNIIVVGAVYNTILRFIWEPQGLQMIVDELLHSVMPVVVLIYWLSFVPKNKLEWKDTFSWLLYPLVYFIYILIRGAISGQYPYPFIDVTELGYSKVFITSVILIVAFFGLSLLFVGLGKLMSKGK